jgi:hypothetical protein
MKRILLPLSACFFSVCGYSQVEQLGTGHLIGSFNTYSQVYQQDDKINAIPPDDKFGSNNYFKLDYNYKRFTAGIQYEAYLPAIQGYPFISTKGDNNEGKLVNKYFRYDGNRFSLQVGDSYEQFGSGLVFRSWENKEIGINNAIEGVNLHVQPTDFLKLKAVYGRPRKYFDYAQADVRAIDGEIDLSELFAPQKPHGIVFSSGFSYVNRYNASTADAIPSNVNAYSGRFSVAGSAAAFDAEFVYKSKDPHVVNTYSLEPGKALLLNGSYTKNNIGITATFRSLTNMDFRSELDAQGTVLPVNYIPALTKQHDYLTTNIYVYNAQVLGEIGGQADVFYNIPAGAKLGGRYGSKISANFSHYGSLKDPNDILSFGDTKYFQDFNIEWKKKWNAKWQTILSYYNINYNKAVIESASGGMVNSQIVVLNTLYKYASKRSLRFELQHLYTKDDLGNWAAGVTEFTFAPMYSVYLSDLYNYGKTDTHYYNVGGSIVKNATRFSLAYGRQRAGLFCVGGVCRYVPAASGFTATLTVTFNN